MKELTLNEVELVAGGDGSLSSILTGLLTIVGSLEQVLPINNPLPL